MALDLPSDTIKLSITLPFLPAHPWDSVPWASFLTSQLLVPAWLLKMLGCSPQRWSRWKNSALVPNILGRYLTYPILCSLLPAPDSSISPVGAGYAYSSSWPPTTNLPIHLRYFGLYVDMLAPCLVHPLQVWSLRKSSGGCHPGVLSLLHRGILLSLPRWSKLLKEMCFTLYFTISARVRVGGRTL